uniref:Uncharacterized protein n=1 Tax=Arundo donax TaxID=35708 RepID=A0A0A8YTZ4_ARUDO
MTQSLGSRDIRMYCSCIKQTSS